MKKILFSLLLLCPFAVGQADDTVAVIIPDDGLYVTTNAILPKEKARIVVEGKLGKDAPEKATAVVEIKYDGKTVWSFVKNMKKDKPFKAEKTMPLAKVWSVDNPSLYTASMTIYEGKNRLSQRTDTFGIKTTRVAKDTGLIVNNELCRLSGITLPAGGWLGDCDQSVIRGIIKQAKDMGCNVLRFEDEDLIYKAVNICDEEGMMLIAGADKVVQLRNHPSIVMWSAGCQAASTCRKNDMMQMTEMAANAKKYDPKRPVTAGLKHIDCAMTTPLGSTLDILGLNSAPHRYNEAKNKSRQHLVLSLNSDMYSEDEREMASEKWVVGQFLHTDMLPVITQTDTFFIYRSLWNDKSHTLHISTSWNRQEGSRVSVTAYSDLNDGELLVNGKSMGHSRTFVWPDVPYEKGEVRVVGYDNNGKQVKSVVKNTSADPAYIEILPTYIGNITFVTLRIKDKDNLFCDNAKRRINIKVEGDCEILGITHGRYFQETHSSSATAETYNGQVTAIVKGNAIVSATSDDLIGGQLQINHNK